MSAGENARAVEMSSGDTASTLTQLVEKNPASYGGAYINDAGQVVLQLIEGDARLRPGRYSPGEIEALSDQIREASLTSDVTIEWRKYSRAHLKQVDIEISKLVRGQQVPELVTAHYIRDDINAVEVGVRKLTPAVEETFNKFGAAVRLVEMEPFREMSRTDDSSPFKGGIPLAMGSPAGSECTAGYAVGRNRVHYGVTAGHCGRRSRTAYHNARLIGDLIQRKDNDQYDSALIDARFAGRIWVGGRVTSTWITVKESASADPVGYSLYLSGTRTGEKCSARIVNSAPGCFTFQTSDGTTRERCNLHLAQRLGEVIVRPGDSGGPVYLRMQNGFLRIHGHIVGGYSRGGDRVLYQPVRITTAVQDVYVVLG
ncbi:hypothetical protein [Carbonactinospora thermoautotrophica]|uniref:hypothetical protein n=1 Tax=Carbonactinospora thermoautotrophica TaxID=1469144 RepID=UPI001301114A|nr:hypothetical protein [Carbonactinospora thermoautotrophica]